VEAAVQLHEAPVVTVKFAFVPFAGGVAEAGDKE
jgi:hypothetical protein